MWKTLAFPDAGEHARLPDFRDLNGAFFAIEESMRQRALRGWIGIFLSATAWSGLAQAPASPGPLHLRVDDLEAPLGIDDSSPSFSWQLADSARGARQTAYRVVVAKSAESLAQNKGDMWDSGRVDSAQSMNIRYQGSPLAPSTRYFWHVQVWGADGKPYPDSQTSVWETGLGTDAEWQAGWIGFETTEEAAVRKADAAWIANPDFAALEKDKKPVEHFAYRTRIELDRKVRRATLYATCQDTVSAWINGSSVLTADPLPPYRQMPWKKYVRADVTEQLRSGANALALECVHYVENPNGMATENAPPLSATLYVEYDDGTPAAFASRPEWKTAIHAPKGWQQASYDDSGWKNSLPWKPLPSDDSPLGHPWIPDSVKALRHDFDLGQPVKSARLYATALGAYELFLNGKRVGEDILAPGWTDYRERVLYQTYDVTAMLAQGRNSIAALLAPGWYATPLEWFQQPNNYGDTPPALRTELRVEYADGSVMWVNSGPEWQAHTSSILHSEIYDGEDQDARRIEPGWNSSGFAGEGWKSAIAVTPRKVPIEAQDFPPIRMESTVAAESVKEPKPGVFVFDFGQNLAGVERVRLEGPAGTDVRVRFAEIINADGTIYTDNLRTAKVTDHFILAGKGTEEFVPQFTFHGFRYAEITGLPAAPAKDAIVALVVHTDAPFSIHLKTGNPMLDKLWSNILWGQRSNFVGVPTDCPQRDERLGWMADAQVFWRTATYDMDIASFSRKFSADMRGSQAGTPFYGIFAPGTVTSVSGSGAGWSDAGVVIPWTSWLQTGDTRIIEQNWDAMEKYLNAIAAANPDGLWKVDSGTPFGDWLSPEGKTDQVLVATAYWAYDVTLMREMARAVGRTQDEEKYRQLFEKIRGAAIKEFVHADGFVAGADNTPSPFGVINNPNAKSKGGDTQTGYVLALHMDLLPEALRAKAVAKLASKIESNHGLLATGFLGTPYLLEELTKAGRKDLAYSLLLNTRYPSWGYLVEHGATTMWERWNGDQMKDDPSMNSYNHYAYGAVADWIYRYAAGVDATPLDAGFHTVVLHPTFDARLGSLSLDYDSSYGAIHSDWSDRGGTTTWNLVLPANTTGWLSTDDARFKIDGTSIDRSTLAKPRTLHGTPGFELPAGSYSFTIESGS